LNRAQEYQQAAQEAYDNGDEDTAQQYMQMHQHHMEKHQHHMQQYEAHQQHHQQQFPNQQWPGHEIGYGPDKRSSRAPADPENFADEGYGQDYKQDTFNQNFGSGQQSSSGGSSSGGYDDGGSRSGGQADYGDGGGGNSRGGQSDYGSGQQSSGGGSSGSQSDDGYAEEEAYEQGQQEDYYR